MRVHHINTGLFALGVVVHCLLIETDTAGLVLVDTGLGTTTGPVAALLRPRPHPTAADQVRALGHTPDDVRHIVLTHLDLDHAGGLQQFPSATVHVATAELHAATHPSNPGERLRYARQQWAHGPRWSPYEPGTENWFNLPGARQLPGLPTDILTVPLPGHTRGHTGIAVLRDSQWLLHAGDSHFTHTQLLTRPSCPAVFALYQKMVRVDRARWLETVEALRTLARDPRVDIICSHDPADLTRSTAH